MIPLLTTRVLQLSAPKEGECRQTCGGVKGGEVLCHWLPRKGIREGVAAIGSREEETVNLGEMCTHSGWSRAMGGGQGAGRQAYSGGRWWVGLVEVAMPGMGMEPGWVECWCGRGHI